MLTKHKLRELIDVTRGMSLPGEYYSETGEYIRLTMGNFNYNGGGFKENTSKTDIYYTGPIRDEYILNKGDIITPLTEQAIGLLGTTAMIPESGKYIQSQDVALVTCKEDKIDHLFCYYLISSELVKKQLSAAAQQTKIRHTSPDKIMDCTVWIPEMELQKNIGKTLFDIDQKIAINTRMNAELEAMAKQLYDYWFVQFDFPDENGNPYKSSGGEMVYNSALKREIPAGWEVKPLNDLLLLEDSRRIPLSNKERENRRGIYPYYGATGIMDYIDDYIFDGDYILLAEDGSTSDKNGNPVVQYIWGKNWVNNHAHIIHVNDDAHLQYYYFLLKTIPVVLIETGSIQKKISQENLLAYSVPIPSNGLIKRYCIISSSYREKQKSLIDETNYLTHLRDSLLPMLMNGQVTVE